MDKLFKYQTRKYAFILNILNVIYSFKDINKHVGT